MVEADVYLSFCREGAEIGLSAAAIVVLVWLVLVLLDLDFFSPPSHFSRSREPLTHPHK